MMMTGTSELDADLPQQIQTVLLTEPKIEDHEIHLGASRVDSTISRRPDATRVRMLFSAK